MAAESTETAPEMLNMIIKGMDDFSYVYVRLIVFVSHK